MEIKIDLESREASDSEIWPLNKPVQNDNISNVSLFYNIHGIRLI